MHKAVTEYLKKITKKGGQSRSAKKVAAVKKNIAKARAVRMDKLKKGEK
jgi:hypothetical protein